MADRLALAATVHGWTEEPEPYEGLTVHRRVSSELTETLRTYWTKHKTPRFRHAEITIIANATGARTRIAVDDLDDLIDYLEA